MSEANDPRNSKVVCSEQTPTNHIHLAQLYMSLSFAGREGVCVD